MPGSARGPRREKIGFCAHAEIRIEGKSGTFAAKKYKNKAGWMPYFEVGLGLYFALTVAYAIRNENYATVPFLLLFVWGYLYTGVMSLSQSWFAHLRSASTHRKCAPLPRALLASDDRATSRSCLRRVQHCWTPSRQPVNTIVIPNPAPLQVRTSAPSHAFCAMNLLSRRYYPRPPRFPI